MLRSGETLLAAAGREFPALGLKITAFSVGKHGRSAGEARELAAPVAKAVMLTVRLDPAAGPPGERRTGAQRLAALKNVWGVLALFVLVLGGIYGGIFTPTEAAGIGASGAFVFAVMRRGWSLRWIYEVLLESAQTTGMIFTILIGALVFANFVNMTSMPAELIAASERFAVYPLLVIVAICVIYLLLGCVLESMSMILLTAG